MADERIDIVVNDKIDPSIAKNLRDISTNATTGATAVQKLKTSLASINDTPTRKLAAATNDLTNSVNRELASQRTVTTARAAATTGLNKEADARDRIAAVIDRTVARLQGEANSINAAASAEGRLAGSRATVARQTEIMRGATQGLAAARQSDAAAARTEQVAQSASNGLLSRAMSLYDGVRDAIYRLAGARQSDAAAARIQEAATEASSNAMRRNSAAAGINRQHMLNLGFQLQDIVVGLTSGQKPLTVFLQQGAQIQGIMGQAQIGVLGLTRAVWALIAPFAPLIAVLGAAYAAFKLFQSDINDRHEPELRKYSESLGLTSKEMKKLGDESVSASGKLKEFNTVTVTAGDMVQGLWKTIAERTGVDESLQDLKTAIIHYVREAVKQAGDAFAILYGEVVGTYRAIVKIWQNFPGILGDAFVQAANKAIDAIEKLVNGSIGAINKFAAGANKLIGVDLFGQIGEVTLNRLERKAGVAGQSIKSVIQGEIATATAEGRAAIDGFMNDWEKNSVQAAKDRLKLAADTIKGDRSPVKAKKEKEDHTAERRAHALEMVNLQLDNELKRMKLLRDEREVQNRMDQITEQLAQKKITLSQAERSEIEQKVRAIQNYAYVQAELDRMYEEAIGPQRTYNAALQAAKQLLDANAISVAKYAQNVVLAKRALEEATDPFFALKEQLTTAEAALGKYGVAAQQAAYYETLRQAALGRGIVLSPQYVAGINSEVDALMRRNAALTQQQMIEQTIGSIVNPMLQDQLMLNNKQLYYDELNRMADAYNLSERQRAQARYALDLTFNQRRLEAASQFFGTLAQLSSSGNKKLALIGKAAAIAQATIDGFLAVQKALASAPPPWNVIQAGAIAVMTGINVAKIISTPVGSYATGGQFMVDGKAGVDANNISMNVTKGERVTVETKKQQREAAAAAGGGSTPVVNVKSIVTFDPRTMLDVLPTSEGDTTFVTMAERNVAELKRLLG